MTLVLFISVLMSVLGGSFQYGYNIAVMNAPAEMMKEYFFKYGSESINVTSSTNMTSLTNVSSSTFNNQSGNVTIEEEGEEYNDQQLLLWAFTISIFTIGGIIGSGLVGLFTQKLGRKKAQLASSLLSFIGGFSMYFSKPAHSIEMVIVARLSLGIFSGLATGMVPLYISEIAPKHIRGALGVVNQLAITIGILCAQLLGLKEALGTETLWNILLAFTCVPSAIQLLVLTFMPESPRYLLIDKNKPQAARKALIRLRGTRNVDDEMEEMEEEANEQKDVQQSTMLQVLKNKTIRWQIICISVLHMTQQLCGINAIFFYLNTIFKAAGVEEDMRNYASCAVGAVNVTMTIISVSLTDRVGRKALIYVGYLIACFFCILMTISLKLQEQIDWVSNLSIASVIGFIVGFAIGPGPIPWIQQTEFFQQADRPAAGSFGTALNWSCNFLLALIFPFLQKSMGPYIFLVFLVVCFCGFLFAYKVVPETKNKSFQEISVLFDELNGIKGKGYDEVEMVDRNYHA